jgi:hypothetical protein
VRLFNILDDSLLVFCRLRPAVICSVPSRRSFGGSGAEQASEGTPFGFEGMEQWGDLGVADCDLSFGFGECCLLVQETEGLLFMLGLAGDVEVPESQLGGC